MIHGDWRGKLAILVGIAFALRLAACAVGTNLGRSPENYREYILTGQRLLAHGTITTPLVLEDVNQAPSSLMPPGYTVLVAAVYGLWGTETVAATVVLRVINAVAASLSIMLVFLIGRRLRGPTAGWLAAGIATINPTLIWYSRLIWDTNLFILGVTLVVWLALRFSETPLSWGRAFVFGVVLGALALLNPGLTLAYPFLVLWMVSRSSGWKIKMLVRGVAGTVLGWALVIAPWTVRNYMHFGELMYIRGGLMFNLWLGACPEADTDPSAVFRRYYPMQNPQEEARMIEMGEHAYIKDCGRRALEAIASDPYRFLRLVGIRTVDYWMGTVFSHAHAGVGGWPTSPIRMLVALFVMAEVLLVIAGIVWVRRPGVEVWWLLAMLIAFSVLYCLTHVQIRYRSPSEPLMAVVLAVLVTQVMNRVRGRRA